MNTLLRNRLANRRRSAFTPRKSAAFTLVEIMIVVLIIGILLAIAVPNFVRARETSRGKACIANLKEIDSAKEQYAMDNKLPTGDTSVAADTLGTGSLLVGPALYIKNAPVCPANGTYTVGNIGITPTCTIGANSAAAYAPHILP
jgi:prepilin-type N-terminal cleavage/methylation domain-containing protein